MVNNFHFARIAGALLLFLYLIGCKGESHSQALINKDSLIVNCYKLKPVKGDSKADSLRNFDFTKESLDNFLKDIIYTKKPVEYDSTMDYVTNFEYQKMILVNYNCFSKLVKPDSCDLINIYFNSGFATWVKKRSTVQFLQTYKKILYNFGKVTVFEYRFNNVAEIEPHYMYIILNEQTEVEKH
jgi:hypothetical protein